LPSDFWYTNMYFFTLSLMINIYIQWYDLCTHKLPSTYTTLWPDPSDVVRWMFECPRVYNRPASVLDRTQGCASIDRLVIASVGYTILLPTRHTFILSSPYTWYLLECCFFSHPTELCNHMLLYIICACDECIYFLLKLTSPRAPGGRLTFLSFRKTIRPWHTAWRD